MLWRRWGEIAEAKLTQVVGTKITHGFIRPWAKIVAFNLSIPQYELLEAWFSRGEEMSRVNAFGGIETKDA